MPSAAHFAFAASIIGCSHLQMGALASAVESASYCQCRSRAQHQSYMMVTVLLDYLKQRSCHICVLLGFKGCALSIVAANNKCNICGLSRSDLTHTHTFTQYG